MPQQLLTYTQQDTTHGMPLQLLTYTQQGAAKTCPTITTTHTLATAYDMHQQFLPHTHTQMAMDDSMAFMGQMECGHLSIQQQLQNQISSPIQKIKAILKSVLKASGITMTTPNIYLNWDHLNHTQHALSGITMTTPSMFKVGSS